MAHKAIVYAALLLAVYLATGCSDGKDDVTDGARSSAPDNSASATALARDEKLVLAFGDSLYAGPGLDSGETFPVRLQAALAGRGIKARVHNGGVSGDTTAAGRQRLAFTLDGMPRIPDLVLVGLGGNDMLRGLDPQVSRDNLDAILAELKRRGIPTMLTGMMAAPNLGRDYGARFNAIYPDLARKYDVPLYPFFLQDVVSRPELMQADRLHPRAAGVAIVVDRVTPMVAEALRRKPRDQDGQHPL